MQTKKHLKKLKFLKSLGLKGKETLDEIKELHKNINCTKLICVHTNGNILILMFLED